MHSRAARRAVSPSINIGAVKSTPTDPEPKPHVLSAKKSGISKPKKSNMKRAQRERYHLPTLAQRWAQVYLGAATEVRA